MRTLLTVLFRCGNSLQRRGKAPFRWRQTAERARSNLQITPTGRASGDDVQFHATARW